MSVRSFDVKETDPAREAKAEAERARRSAEREATRADRDHKRLVSELEEAGDLAAQMEQKMAALDAERERLVRH
eukprot:1180108-Prorocentrum_minimum.AAC.1